MRRIIWSGYMFLIYRFIGRRSAISTIPSSPNTGWFGRSSSMNSATGILGAVDANEPKTQREREVKSREKELEERKQALDQREKEVEDRTRGLDDRERKAQEGLVEMQRKIERRERELEERREEFEKEREDWPNMAEWKASIRAGLEGYLALLK